MPLKLNTYAVGILGELVLVYRAVRLGKRANLIWTLRRLRTYLSFQVALIRHRDWRALKNSFNGYLCEPTPWPDGLKRCGSGWTRKRAQRSLARLIARRAGGQS